MNVLVQGQTLIKGKIYSQVNLVTILSRNTAGLEWVEQVHARYTKRMHNLGDFMKTVLALFTHWLNSKRKRTGTLWEERFKSVIVESGTEARMMAAYIDRI